MSLQQPACRKCRIRMGLHSTQVVNGPARTPCSVNVYECENCGWLTAEAVIISEDHPQAA
jgi:hypothetical protein